MTARKGKYIFATYT